MYTCIHKFISCKRKDTYDTVKKPYQIIYILNEGTEWLLTKNQCPGELKVR